MSEWGGDVASVRDHMRLHVRLCRINMTIKGFNIL